MDRPIVLVGGCPRSGTHLVGNALGSGPEALYFPVELALGELAKTHPVDMDSGLSKKIAGIADFMRRGIVDASSNREVHEVRGFDGDEFTRSFFDRWDGSGAPAAILSAYVGALRDCRRQPEAIRFTVEKSPQNELIYGGLAASDLDLRFIHIIRPLTEVYASWKAKFLRANRDFYHPSLNLSIHIIEVWRRSLCCAEDNLRTHGPEKYRIVEFADAVELTSQFVESLSAFIFPSDRESRAALARHLGDVSRGAELSNRYVRLQSNSSFAAHATTIDRSLLKRDRRAPDGWEERLCEEYGWLYERVRELARHPGRRLPDPGSAPSAGRTLGLVVNGLLWGHRLWPAIPPVRRAFVTSRANAVSAVLESRRWLTDRRRRDGS